MRQIISALFLVSVLLAGNACTSTPSSSIEISSFGKTSRGEEVTLYRLINPNGAFMEVINYGCRVVRIGVPDREGKLDDIVLGYDNIDGYESGQERYFGALVGRYANRIANGRFTLDSTTYQLSCNDAPNGIPCHLHGGEKGFDRVMWNAEIISNKDTAGIRFFRLSPDGEEGYPGNLLCDVRYYWTPDNIWRIEYRATTDKPTIVNMSQHCFFNLKGRECGTVLDNYLTVYGDSVTPNTPGYVPTGEIVTVEGGPLDFRTPHTFEERINQPNEHMKIMGGYSANWVLNNQSGELAKASVLYESLTGRTLEVWTTEPGLLIYTGRLLSNEIIGKYNKPYNPYDGLILETIHYPNSPNQPHFPSCVLRPSEEYYSVTEYRFGVK